MKKSKILTLFLSGLAFCLIGQTIATTNASEAIKAETTYVSVYSNNCEKGTKQPNGYDSYCTQPVNNIDWRVQGYPNYDGGWRIGGGKNTTSGERRIFTETPLTDSVEKIEIDIGTTNSATINVTSVTLNVYSNCASHVLSGLVDTIEKSSAPQTTVTFLNEGENDWANKYYEFVFYVEINDTANKYVRLNRFEFFKVAVGDEVSLDTESLNLNVGETVTINATASGEVVWESSNEEVVTVTSEGDLNKTAIINAKKDGEATITATVGSASAVCKVNVSQLINKFEKITDWSDINYGDVVVFVFKTANAVITSVESNSMKSTSQLINGVIDEYMPFQVVKGTEANSFGFITSNGKYLNNTSDTTLALAGTLSIKSSWTVQFIDGVAKVTNCNTGRFLAWRSSTNYARAYNTNYNDEYSAPTFYRYAVSSEEEVNEARSFAALFLNALRADDVCDVAGVNTNKANLKEIWANYETKYNELSVGSKAYIAKTKQDANGNDLEQLLNTYHFILTKYNGESGLEDFMFRGVSASNAINVLINDNNLIIIAICLIALIGCSMLIIHRKRVLR